jgi:hypothetical protein
MSIIQCTREESDIIKIALSGYLNHYKKRLLEIDDEELKDGIVDRVRLVENMLSNIGA